MLAGYLHLATADPGSDDEELGMMYLALGAEMHRQAVVHRRLRRGGRYGPRGVYDKTRTRTFVDALLEKSTDRFFRNWFCVDRTSFDRLLELIKDDLVFASQGRHPQAPVRYQLTVYPIRYGNVQSIKTAIILQLSEGSMYNHCRRVTKAFCNLRDLYIKWPDKAERKEIKREAQAKGFPGDVSAVDGSYIPILERPRKDGMSFRFRKKFYATTIINVLKTIPKWNVQIIVDFEGKITSYDLGWPGSSSNRTIFRNSHFWIDCDNYPGKGEYIIADGGYFLSKWAIPPYQDFELTDERRAKKQWNKSHSSLRIIVEHVYGRLKSRFPYLSGIHGWDLDEMLRVIKSLFVVHNILMTLNDLPALLDGVDLNTILREQAALGVPNPAPAQGQAREPDNSDELRV